jgi:hypothetical protein
VYLGCPDVAVAVGVCVFPDSLDLACLESIDCCSARDTDICPCCRGQVVYALLTRLYICEVGCIQYPPSYTMNGSLPSVFFNGLVNEAADTKVVKAATAEKMDVRNILDAIEQWCHLVVHNVFCNNS